jgi:hypothetical protein
VKLIDPYLICITHMHNERDNKFHTGNIEVSKKISKIVNMFGVCLFV